MQNEEYCDKKKFGKKIRVRVKTNKNVKFITSIRQQASVSELANRILSVYMQLSADNNKKQMTVSAIKQGIFYMPKSQMVNNILCNDDQIEVDIIKARPKYPNIKQGSMSKQQIQCNNQFNINQSKRLQLKKKIEDIECKQSNINILSSNNFAPISDEVKRQKKRQRKKNRLSQIILSTPNMSNELLSSKQSINKQSDEKIMTKQNKQKIQSQLNHSLTQIKPFSTNAQNKIQSQKPRRQKSWQDVVKKKVKLDQQIVDKNLNNTDKNHIAINDKNYIDKNHNYVPVPSPRITFHSDPYIKNTQSPKPLLQSKKRQQKRKISQDSDFKLTSPLANLKSPFIKTPIQLASINEKKDKQNQQLFNFSLIKKNQNIQKNEIQIKNLNIQDTKQKISVQKKNIVIIQPQSQSENEQNKKIQPYRTSQFREKQIMQINKKVSNYMIDSDSQ